MELATVAEAPYGELLAGCRRAAGLSQRELAGRANMDHANITRTESGERAPAGPDEVVVLAAALGLDPARRDDLLVSAGFWPVAFYRLGPADATMRAVADALAGPLTAERQELRTAIHALLRLATGRRVVAEPVATPAPVGAGVVLLRPGRRPAGARRLR